MKLKVKRTSRTAVLPTRGSAGAAGIDLYADATEPVAIHPGQHVMLHTNIVAEIPSGYFGAVYARSGIAVRCGLRPTTCVSVIDDDYRGEIGLPIRNDSDKVQIVKPGERIAQMVIQKYYPVEVVEVDEVSGTERGAGGFGSTGKV